MNGVILGLLSVVGAERSAGNVALIEKNSCIRNCHIGPVAGNTPLRIQCERGCRSEFDRIKADCEAGAQIFTKGLDLCSTCNAQLPVPVNPSQQKAHQECIIQCRLSTTIDGEVCQMGCSLKLETIQQECQKSVNPDSSTCKGVPTRSVDPALPTPTIEVNPTPGEGKKSKAPSTTSSSHGIALAFSLPISIFLAIASYF